MTAAVVLAHNRPAPPPDLHVFDPGEPIVAPERRQRGAAANHYGYPSQCARPGCWGWYDDPRHIPAPAAEADA